MKREFRNGQKIIVFDDIEEMKWFYHARLCRNPGDSKAIYITRMYKLGISTPEEANKYLKTVGEPCEVKT